MAKKFVARPLPVECRGTKEPVSTAKPKVAPKVAPVVASNTKKKSGSKLPADEYKPVGIEESRIVLTDKVTLVYSVTRKGDLGTPHVDVREWLTSPTYSGPTQKGINFDIEHLEKFIAGLQNVLDEARGLDLIE